MKKIVRLQSGEELLATVEQLDGKVTLTEITIILPTQQGTIQLSPFMPYAEHEDGITFAEDKILFMVDPHVELGKEHDRIFEKSAGILVPNSKIIV